VKFDWNYDPAKNPPEYRVDRLRGTRKLTSGQFTVRRLKFIFLGVIVAAMSVASYLIWHRMLLSVLCMVPMIFAQPALESYSEYVAAWSSGNDDDPVA
jgi:uncharacterized membrane protein